MAEHDGGWRDSDPEIDALRTRLDKIQAESRERCDEAIALAKGEIVDGFVIGLQEAICLVGAIQPSETCSPETREAIEYIRARAVLLIGEKIKAAMDGNLSYVPTGEIPPPAAP